MIQLRLINTVKKLFGVYLTIFLAYEVSYAQVNIGGLPFSIRQQQSKLKKQDITLVPSLIFSPLDKEKVEREDIEDAQKGLPPRFGVGHTVQINLNNAGKWTILEKGDRLWQLRIECKQAKSINLLFDKFWLPEGGVLHIYSQNQKHIIGGFTSNNNKGPRDNPAGFGTGLVYGDQVIIEYYEPKDVLGTSIISIANIVHGYRYINIPKSFANEATEFYNASGACQVNVNCSPEGNNWQNEKRGVAMILVNGNRVCTGSLINNARNNGDLLFLTANHCLNGTADAVSGNQPLLTNWSFVWNYESPTCPRGAGFDPDPTLLSTTNGARLLANNSNSDFALLRLTESPLQLLNPPVNAYFNGWDRTVNPGQGGVGIHHPSGDVKKIATHTIVPINGTNIYTGSPGQNFWQIQWSKTTNGFSVTEGGSSGSPLLSNNSLIIGQLFGGSNINCADPANDPAVYGKLSVSWNGSTDSKRRLRDWLDPLNTNLASFGGAYHCLQDEVINYSLIGTHTIQVNNSITASNTIASGARITLRAGNGVSFNPGFICTGELLALIGGCASPGTSSTRIAFDSSAEEEKEDSLTSEENLLTAAPNPTESFVTFRYSIKGSGKIKLELYDSFGRKIAILVDEQTTEGGIAEKNYDTASLATGLYLYSLEQGNKRIVKKLLVIH